ncbi:GNAT family N-acetyltransferase [Virgisporangium ochraceum]|uniref:N-acetyltransferase n=1 Tax=Virgisporangium ochraceum TaxID=65505 RepID=A0A8J3ZZM8_9ACTN|nr:GNAT family N-acetyltransferase [Virgisporangium ochraceum]GIJ73124.1 N-acetyltransferase [Virgisporangium ochraceum]
MTGVRFRPARSPADVEPIAALHADNWRRTYRGAYSDAFLDGELLADRRVAWSARLADPGPAATTIADHDGQLVGFVHVVFGTDPRWGSLLYNLHVVHDRRRTGIGRQLLRHAALAVDAGARGRGMFLWVLEQNTAAQRFYLACGATATGIEPVPPPGGDPSRLVGSPRCVRMVWPEVGPLIGA